MSNTSVPGVGAPRGSIGPTVSRRSPLAARRRALVVVMLLILLGVAVLANYGPIKAYRDAQDRLDKATAEVAKLDAQKTELQSQLGKLTEAGYLESMARQELTYARPGEDLYIITGSEEEASTADAAEPADGATATPDGGATAAPAEQPGLLERIVSSIVGLF